MSQTVVDDMPFGGIGPSGTGHYHGKEGSLSFSKAKGVVRKGRLEANTHVRAPCGNKLYEFFVNHQLRRPSPRPVIRHRWKGTGMLNSILTIGLRGFTRAFPAQKPLVFSGPAASLKLADLMIVSGQRRPLLVTDSFLLTHGLVDELLGFLATAGCDVTVFDGVVPNPTVAVVEAGVRASLANECDAVLAVGGGSALDAAKVIAAASTSNRDVSQLAGILKVKSPPLPFYAVPTTSGTGSEATTTAVISDATTHKKAFFVDPKYIPIATALDASLTRSMPRAITAMTGMDALTHAIEAYTARNRTYATDRDAATAATLLFDFLPAAYDDGQDLRARDMVALGSFLAGYAFTRASVGYVHAISHQISARYDTAHGLANAVILPRVLRFNAGTAAHRYAALDAAVRGNSARGDVGQLAKSFITRVDELIDHLDIPRNLDDVHTDDFGSITKDALREARLFYAVPRVMKPRDMTVLLHSIAGGSRDVAFA